jgi:dihydrofolate reductase
MPGPGRYVIEGYAIISADGMLGDHNRRMPQTLHIPADQRLFTDALDRAALVVHGRHSHEEQGAASDRRRRVILTRSVAAIAEHPSLPNALLWNPAGAAFAEACRASGVSEGLIVVSGAAEVFALFLRLGYDAFHLSRVATVRLPGGRPVFPTVPEQSPEEVLSARGLIPGATRTLDAEAQATLVVWRPPTSH